MQKLILCLFVFSSLNAAAQMEDRSPKGGPHNASAVAGFNRGGFTFGAAYEYMYQDSMGVGAHLRWFNKEDSGTNRANGLFIIGAGAGHHFYKKSWDLSFTPSLNIINIDSVGAGDDSTTFGPGLSIALLCQVSSAVAVGFDFSNYYVWFDDDYAGQVISDMAFKIRMGF